MQITLNQKEIEKAIVDFVCGQGVPLGNRDVAIKLTVDKELTAAIVISSDTFSQGFTSNTATTPKNPLPDVPSSEPKPAQPVATPEPVFGIEADTETDDREAIKAELDALGIAYAAKAHTPTLKALLEEAKATKTAYPVPAEEETASMFGWNTEQPTALAEETPFDTNNTEQAAPTTEEELDDMPLFGM